MATGMTSRDRRAVALLSKYGVANAIPFQGRWTCGGFTIGQTTVRRLLERGLAARDADNPNGRIVRTDATAREARAVDMPPLHDRDFTPVPFSGRGRGPDRDTWEFEDTGWRPDDVEDRAGRPVPLDRLMR